ncbi:hypothetical protein MBLNU459_g4538t1 [Dothideomycetes sp. NU459]
MASPSVDASAKPTATTDVPPTSTADDGLSRRPRDARLIHLILSAQGIHSYQERVPLQLLDFAYRYTSSVLSDALRLSAEGYSAAPGTTSSKRAADNDGSNITVSALRQAIASRQDYQFQGPLPKEFMLEQASERNRTVLPKIEKSWGVQLPPEKYCLTGTGWGLKEQWDSEDEESAEARQENGHASNDGAINGGGMSGMDEADEQEEGGDSFEDVFGTGDNNNNNNNNNDEDQEMAEG